jgi:hypothetical protein
MDAGVEGEEEGEVAVSLTACFALDAVVALLALVMLSSPPQPAKAARALNAARANAVRIIRGTAPVRERSILAGTIVAVQVE